MEMLQTLGAVSALVLIVAGSRRLKRCLFAHNVKNLSSRAKSRDLRTFDAAKQTFGAKIPRLRPPGSARNDR